MLNRTVICLLLALCFTRSVNAQDQVRLLKVLEWRSELIRSLAFTSDGKQLVVSPKDNDCWVFDAETGAKSDVDLKGGRGPTIYLLPGPRPGIVYCIENRLIRLIDTTTGKELGQYSPSADFSAGGQLSLRRDLLAMASASGSIELLTADLKRRTGTFSPTEPLPANRTDAGSYSAAYSSDGKHVALGLPTGRMTLWTVDGFAQAGVTEISAHAGKVDSLIFTTSELISLGLDGKVKRWNPVDGKELATFSIGVPLDRGWLLAEGQIAAIVRRPVAGELEFFQIPTKTGEPLQRLATIPVVTLFNGFPTVHREFTIPQIALSPNGQRLALAAQSGSSGLTITQTGIYDVSSFMPKLAFNPGVASGNEASPTMAGTKAQASSPPATKPPPVLKVEREFREWTTADGKFKVEAQFVGKLGSTVRLERKDTGNVVSIPLEKLSDVDQAYVKGLR